jgi:hypothetical protein
MSVEGIFRKTGNIRRRKELIVALDRDSSSVDWSTEHAVQIAALLKQFFRDLPDPLLTFKLHRLFIASAGAYEGRACPKFFISDPVSGFRSAK